MNLRRLSLTAALLCLGACASSSPPAPAPTMTAVTVSWVAPTVLTDHSALTDLTGYDLTYALAGSAAQEESVVGTSALLNLAAGTYNFSVAAVSASHGVGLPATVTYTVP
jgi:hypothetical protein